MDHVVSGVWVCICHFRIYRPVVCAQFHADIDCKRIQGIWALCENQHCQQFGRAGVYGDVCMDDGSSRRIDQCGYVPEHNVLRDALDDPETSLGGEADYPGEIRSSRCEGLFQVFFDGIDFGGSRAGIPDVAEGICDNADLADGGRLVGGYEPDIEYVPDGHNVIVWCLLSASTERTKRYEGTSEGNIQGIQSSCSNDAGRVRVDLSPEIHRDPDSVYPGVHADVEAVRLAVGGGFL